MRRIAKYTKAEWGAEQARQYAERMRQRIKSLREFPLRYPEVVARPGLREMRCGQHIVFYQVSADAIEIVHVLHVAADFDARL
jgi:plasmid stabilization system protein ParE